MRVEIRDATRPPPPLAAARGEERERGAEREREEERGEVRERGERRRGERERESTARASDLRGFSAGLRF